jgi:hypothetical protein
VSTEESKAVSRRVLEEIFSGGNLDLADELYATDYVLHEPSLPEDLHGPEASSSTPRWPRRPSRTPASPW